MIKFNISIIHYNITFQFPSFQKKMPFKFSILNCHSLIIKRKEKNLTSSNICTSSVRETFDNRDFIDRLGVESKTEKTCLRISLLWILSLTTPAQYEKHTISFLLHQNKKWKWFFFIVGNTASDLINYIDSRKIIT